MKKSKIVLHLILIFLIGFLVASTAFLSWSDLVENAQLASGYVEYPIKTPQYYFQKNLYSLPAQIMAFLYSFGGSELALSLISSGLLGGLSFASLWAVSFLSSRSVAISYLMPFLCEFVRMNDFGLNYSISIVDTTKPSGQIGIAFLILAVTLRFLNFQRLGSFLIGLMPAIHLPIGLFCYLSSFLYLLLIKNYKDLKWFLFGLMTFTLSYGVHLYGVRDIPFVTEIQTLDIKNFLKYFIENWDVHRVGLEHAPLGASLLVLGLVFLLIDYFKDLGEREEKLFNLYFMIYIVVCSFIYLLGLFDGPLQQDINRLMPLRALNAINWFIGVYLLCELYRRSKYIFYTVIGFLLLTPFYFTGFRFVPSEREMQSLCVLAVLAFTAMMTLILKKRNERKDIWFGKYYINLLLFSLISYYLWLSVVSFGPNLSDLKYWKNDKMYSHIKENHNLLLSCPNCWGVQLRSAKPVLLEVDTMDDLVYFPSLYKDFNSIFKELYGLDLLNRPQSWPTNVHVPRGAIKNYWENRTRERWRELSKHFSFSGVIVDCDWNLKLDKYLYTSDYCLYEIK